MSAENGLTEWGNKKAYHAQKQEEFTPGELYLRFFVQLTNDTAACVIIL